MKRRSGHRLLTATLLLAGVSGCKIHYPLNEWTQACERPAVVSHAASPQARSILLDALAEDRGAGISAAVMIDGELVWREAVGIARDHPDQPLTPGARMRIGSIAKSFTAVAAVRLAERGLLDLDAPIQTYVPDYPARAVALTARHLATHTSGIRQYDFSSFSDSNNTTHYDSLTAAFAEHKNDSPLTEPGGAYGYSSLAFNLLGIVIERAYGTSYEQAIRDLVTEPMGLPSTSTDDATRHTPCRPDFYSMLFGKFQVETLWRDNSDLYPSGGLLSTAEDLARFANLTFDGAILSPATVALLQRQAQLSDGTALEYGFGWQIVLDEGGDTQWIGHGGTINGAYASVRYYPRDKMAVAGITNYDFVLTGRRAAFFSAVRERLPALFRPGS